MTNAAAVRLVRRIRKRDDRLTETDGKAIEALTIALNHRDLDAHEEKVLRQIADAVGA